MAYDWVELDEVRWEVRRLAESAWQLTPLVAADDRNRQVRRLFRAIQGLSLPQLVDCVMGYHHLGLLLASPDAWPATAAQLAQLSSQPDSHAPVLHILSVDYEQGLDWDAVVAHTGLSPEAWVRLHTEAVFEVAMTGFLPGFVYLDGLPPELSLPRKSTPARQVPPGSVAIAGLQCGLYALPSPGGWHVIGNTAEPLLRWDAHPPNLLLVGDRVRFRDAKS